MIKNVKLYVNSSKEKAVITAEKVKQALIQHGYEIVEQDADLVIGFGGDGTLLKWFNEQKELPKEKYIGVNCGTLGFMQDFEIEYVEDFVKNIPTYIEKRLNYLHLQFISGSRKYTDIYSVNDFAILDADDKTFRANVSIDRENLETYVGTGLIFASPMGSTARNISSVGSIMFPELQAFQMTPIEPIVNSKIHCMPKSICIPSIKTVILTPVTKQKIKIKSDGICVYEGVFDEISISLSEKYMTTLTDKKNSFVKKIREKLI